MEKRGEKAKKWRISISKYIPNSYSLFLEHVTSSGYIIVTLM